MTLIQETNTAPIPSRVKSNPFAALRGRDFVAAWNRELRQLIGLVSPMSSENNNREFRMV